MTQSRFLYGLSVLVAAALMVAGIGAGLVRHMTAQPSANTNPVYLYVMPGASLGQVAREAEKMGLVRKAWQFKLVARLGGIERKLFSGEYEVQPGTSLSGILAAIRGRAIFQRRIVLPEGMTVLELEAVLSESFGLDMIGYVRPSEGTLLPDTYFYERGDSAVALLARMQKAMAGTFERLWAERQAGLPFESPGEALALASIVEKETALAEERPLVAAVFVNRLKRKMRLQSDPTVIYGITGGLPLARALTAADLAAVTPYNTYRISGLPPGPIANPGRASLEAVLNPADVPYLYFVADATGGHAFASTLKEHNRNVARWRETRKKAQ